jgi:hypothetical protein
MLYSAIESMSGGSVPLPSFKEESLIASRDCVDTASKVAGGGYGWA